MEPRNVILWTLLVVLAVLVMSAGVQAQELREVPASEILEKIRAGEDIYLENVRITGELNVSKIELKTVPIARERWKVEDLSLEEELKIVESDMIIVNSVFENDVDFSNTQFRKTLAVIGTSFLGSDFRGADFIGKAAFWEVSFGDYSSFEGASFGGFVNFGGASFGGDANFEGASFGGVVNFRGASFGVEGASFVDYSSFKGVSFGGDADFKGVSFGHVLFNRASFGGDANFEGASFGGVVAFREVSFGDDANFRMASFGGFVNFEGASFGGDANFRMASFGGDADFKGASFGGDAFFNSTKFDKVCFSNTRFNKVYLYETDFKSMNVDLSSLEDALVFDRPAYMKLIKNFREMEQFGDADDAYYQYRRLSQADKKWSFSKLGDIFMWLSCGYGVKPQYTIILAVVMILIFTLIYWLGNGIRRLKESDEGRYLFSWDNVPGKDNERLIRYLGSNFGIDQAENVEIRKSDDGKTIYICNDDESTKIMIDEKEKKATLKTSDHETLHLKVKKESGELNIYKEGKEDVSFCDAFYFSVVTFTTVGYGDWYPKDRYRKFVMIEGLLGWLILALFLVTLANVMIRP